MQKSILELSNRLPILSLEKLAQIRVTTILCNHPALLSLIQECISYPYFDETSCFVNEEEWAVVLTMAERMVSQIEITVALKEKILELLWPVSYKIKTWCSVYGRPFMVKFLHNFYWTDRGKIDNIRTARYIVKNKRISIRKRFVLACNVCLRNEIHEMWGEMSNKDKMIFLRRDNQYFSPLLLFWAHTMEGSDNVLAEFLPGALACAVENGSLEAVKYLFSVLTANSRRDMATLCVKKFILYIETISYLGEDKIAVGYFCFFELTDELQVTFFNRHSLLPLSLLLNSSEDKLFLNLLAERIQSLSIRDIRKLLLMIFHNYLLEVKHCDYSVLLVDVWRMLSSSMRRFNEETEQLGCRFLVVLIRDNFPFLLEERAFEKIPDVVSSSIKNSTSTTPFGFHLGKWKLLHVLILEEIVTIESLKKNKSEFLSLLRKTRNADRAIWNRILRFVEKIANAIPE